MSKKPKLWSIFLAVTVMLLLMITFSFIGCKEAEEVAAPAEEEVAEEAAPAEEEVAEEAPAEEVVLRIWKGPHTEDDGAVFADAIAVFEADHPGVKIEYTPTPWDTIIEKYTTAFASGNPPDVFYGFTGGYVDGVVPMCYDYREIFTEEEMAFLGKGVPENLYMEMTLGDKLLGVPWLAGGASLVYNKDLLEEAGFSNPPDTIEKQLEMAKALTKDDQYGYGQLSYETAEAKPEFFLFAFGCNLLTEDMENIDYNREEGLEAFKYIDQLWNIDKSAVPTGLYPGTTMTDAFFDNKFAMWCTHSQIVFNLADYPDFNLGISKMPQGPGKDFVDGRGTYVGTAFWAIPESITGSRLELVKDFIKILYTPEYQIPIMSSFGFTPASTELEVELTPYQEAFQDSYLNHGVPYRFSPVINEVKEAVWNAMQALQSGAIGPEEAWQQAIDNGMAAFE